MIIKLDSLKPYVDEAIEKAVKDLKHDFIEKMRADLLSLQTYKLFEGEKDVYVERDEVMKILEKYTEGSEEEE